jgi:Tol biopolymer transport system component
MNRPLRISISLVLFGVCGLALAQTAYDPAIAYTQAQGRSTHLYVANADGSHAVRIASTTYSINGADFAPGGGRIAFTGTEGLRVVQYTATNSGVTVNGNTLLAAGTIGLSDFSADGSRLLYYQIGNTTASSGFRVIPAGGGTPVLVHAAVADGHCHWLRSQEMGNAFAYLAAVGHGPNVPVDYEIRVVLMDESDQVTSVSTVLTTANQAFKAISDFDIARTRNALVVAANFPTALRILDYDIGTMQLADLGGSGTRVHYNANDSAVVFREQVKGGSYVSRLDLASGMTTRLTAKGDFVPADARP